MVALAVINVALGFLLIFWPLWFSRRFLSLPLLNPITITLAIGLPVQMMKLFGGPLLLIEDGLFNNGYQYALLMGNLQTFSQIVGTVTYFYCARALGVERWLPFKNITLSRGDMRRAAMVFLLLFFAALLLLASAEFGIVNWLLNPREGYQYYRMGQGHWYALAISSLSVFTLLSFVSRPSPLGLMVRAPLILGLAYLLGSKGILLAVFTAILVFLWFMRWRHLGKMLILGTPVVFALMVWNLYLALAEDFDAESVVAYFDYYKNAADYYQAVLSGDIGLFFGDVTLSSFWSYVPRALWPEKPFVYGVTLVNEIFFPGAAEQTHTPAFGGAVEQFADFGVVGVVLFGFFGATPFSMAVLSYLTFRRPGIDLQRMTLASVLLLLVQFAPSFGAFFPGALYFAAVLAVALTIVVVRHRSKRQVAGRDWQPADSAGQ